MLAYRVGFLGWKVAARLGVPLKVVVKVVYDKDTGYMTASSEDFLPQAGIVAEAKTWDELVKEVKSEIAEAMEFIFKQVNEDRIIPYYVPSHA